MITVAKHMTLNPVTTHAFFKFSLAQFLPITGWSHDVVRTPVRFGHKTL
jgi:hypothetical protein